MNDFILAVDVGTQSVKAGIYDSSLELKERVQLPLTTRVLSGGRVEMDAEEIWKAFADACRMLSLKERAGALSFSTLCPSLVPISGDGAALYPVIIHQDRRSSAQSRNAIESVGREAFMRINGNLPVPGGISLTSILWLKDNYPGIYERPDVCFGHIDTFLLKRLCGNFIIDPSNASFTGLYDTVGFGDWHEELCAPLGIDIGKLPGIRMSYEQAGRLGREAATELGLTAGIPVAAGANDTTCAAVGAGVSESGQMMNTSGTVDILVLCSDRPIVSERHLLRTHAYPDRWLAMRTVGAGGGSLEWFRKNFCRELSCDEFYSEYLPEVLAETAETDAVFRPFLSGNRHSTEDESASFLNISLKTDREEFLRAMLTGITEFQFGIINYWREIIPLSDTVFHVGGGAKDEYTAFKQRMLGGLKLEQLGETAMIGAAKLGLDSAG